MIVAFLLPLLVAVLALVVDVVAISTEHQRLSGAAQLSADAGATIVARDIVAILVVRHWCQPSITFASWDASACTTADSSNSDQSVINLNNDCPWVLRSANLVDATISDSVILSECVGEQFSSYSAWPRVSYANLQVNEPSLSNSNVTYSCAGICTSSNNDSNGCSSSQVVCVEVVAQTTVSAPLVGTLIGAAGSQVIEETAYASVSLPGNCSNLKPLIVEGSGDCPVQ